MNTLDRNNQPPASLRKQDTFDAIQRSSTNAYALANFKKRIRSKRNVVGQ